MELTVNGRKLAIEVSPEVPLLWVLRDYLNLTGTKFGCGQGLCGACTVHLNGNPLRSCVTPVSVAVDGEITTIEGLSPDVSHPIQVAWIENRVPQCGYCQSGQIMSAAALIVDNPNPTNEEIDFAMAGNICRCGTYTRIRSAIKQASEQVGDLK